MVSFDVFCGVSILLLLIFLALISIDSVFYYPLASETALRYCLNKGFDYADSFTKIPLSLEPLGVKCKNAFDFDVDIKRGDLNV